MQNHLYECLKEGVTVVTSYVWLDYSLDEDDIKACWKTAALLQQPSWIMLFDLVSLSEGLKNLKLFLSFIFLYTLAKKSGTPHSDPSPSHQVGQIQLVNVHGKVHYLLKAKIHAVLIDLLVWLSEGLQLFRRLLSLILSLSGRNNRHLCR